MNDGNFRLITLTNSGYKSLTENCIQSLINIDFPLDKLIIYSMDTKCQKYFEKKYPQIECNLSNYFKEDDVSYMKDDWNNVTIQKINIVHTELKKYEHLILFDGDIVFNNIKFLNFLLDKMNNNKALDLLAQHEFKDDGGDEICSGFYIIRSNAITNKYYNTENLKKKKMIKSLSILSKDIYNGNFFQIIFFQMENIIIIFIKIKKTRIWHTSILL